MSETINLVSPVTEQATEAIKPLAVVAGEPMYEVPHDLFILPEAMEVILETFSGPLDLLLYLIRRHNLDILNLSISTITEQYIQYIELMKELKLELAGEYLLMAATLLEIKSRLLLPQPELEENLEEEDPRMQLIRRLQVYEQFKNASQQLDEYSRLGRDRFKVETFIPDTKSTAKPEVSLFDLLAALKSVLLRSEQISSHDVTKEPLSVREKMTTILDRLQTVKKLKFHELFDFVEGRLGRVTTFLALLELLKMQALHCTQVESFGIIHVVLGHE